jgi:hypothetical protein
MGVYLVVSASRVVAWATPGERKFATDLGGSEDVLDGDGNLGANAITLNQADSVATLQTKVSRIAHAVELLLPWAV